MQTSKRLAVLGLPSRAKRITRHNTTVASVLDANDDVKLKSWKDIPGPKSYPIIGQLLSFLPGQKLANLNFLQENMYEMYGPIVRLDGLLGRESMLVLFDPEAIAFVYRSENLDPVRPGFGSLEHFRKRYNKKEDPSRPTGLITDHHEVWKKFRLTVNPVLLQPKTIKLYKSAVDKVADDMIKRMRSLRNEKNMIDADFNAEMNLWSLESIGVIALGGRLNCFDQTLPEDSPEKRLIACVHNIFKTQNDLDFGLSFWRYFPTPAYKKAMKLYAEQESLTKHFIERARKEMLTNKKSDDEKGVLEKLLEIDERCRDP